jgi:RimJ/RimL family protein N-acetyltransferase
MIIESERLTYHKWDMNDFEILKTMLGNPNVCKYLPGEKPKKDPEIQRWLNYYVQTFGNEFGTKIFKVKLKDTNQVIGYCGLGYVKEFDHIEIMYGLAEEYFQKGYASEMSLRIKDLAIEQGIKQLIGFAATENIPSNKILLKTGYTKKEQIELWGMDLNYYEMNL